MGKLARSRTPGGYGGGKSHDLKIRDSQIVTCFQIDRIDRVDSIDRMLELLHLLVYVITTSVKLDLSPHCTATRRDHDNPSHRLN